MNKAFLNRLNQIFDLYRQIDRDKASLAGLLESATNTPETTLEEYRNSIITARIYTARIRGNIEVLDDLIEYQLIEQGNELDEFLNRVWGICDQHDFSDQLRGKITTLITSEYSLYPDSFQQARDQLLLFRGNLAEMRCKNDAFDEQLQRKLESIERLLSEYKNN